MNILITGAGRGLGLELAAECLGRGHHVLAGLRRPEQPSPEFRALADQHGERLEPVRLDVADEAGIAELAARLSGQGRQLGAIVNNAAVLEARETPIERLDLAFMESTMDINLYGPMRVAKHLLPLLTEPDAALINISSEAGSMTNAYPGDYPYTLSKAAMNLLTEQLSRVLAERGAIALSVHPGWMRTDMGGEQAKLDPRESARGIADLIERRVEVPPGFRFVDYLGRPMAI
ncbi:SDR family oxidoreductase [Paenibacillus sp. B01]|uniref:SDR family oxidoreductase n=1 Tax=Paenibacillus sp. B01 TaxID=2660554 RepID=UPI00129A5C40|nr:SDR family oxidoreductase [Paenibacillus sp. B01]QGG57800.1 SDR family NAD(P)-dependent oxidoreductase [Paenibacillus sp. B01]